MIEEGGFEGASFDLFCGGFFGGAKGISVASFADIHRNITQDECQ